MFAPVTESAFSLALAGMEIIEDEFNENVYVVPKEFIYLSEGSRAVQLAAGLGRDDKSSPWEAGASVSYAADDFLQMDTLDLKSAAGVYTITGLDIGRTDDYLRGRPYENGFKMLSDSEFSDVCETLSGDELKIRLSGSAGSITLDVTTKKRQALYASCTVFAGVKQGFPITTK